MCDAAAVEFWPLCSDSAASIAVCRVALDALCASATGRPATPFELARLAWMMHGPLGVIGIA
jgi:hypothetical protein